MGKEASAKYYSKNKELVLERNKKIRQKKKDYIREAKNVPCADCGIQYPHYVMDFDHRDPNEKEANIALMVSQGFGWDKVLNEIAKCDIVCSNCHRERTFG
jgi:hypothetical protein